MIMISINMITIRFYESIFLIILLQSFVLLCLRVENLCLLFLQPLRLLVDLLECLPLAQDNRRLGVFLFFLLINLILFAFHQLIHLPFRILLQLLVIIDMGPDIRRLSILIQVLLIVTHHRTIPFHYEIRHNCKPCYEDNVDEKLKLLSMHIDQI